MKEPLDPRIEEALMWAYATTMGADSIVGLHVCDNYLEWRAKVLSNWVK